ncbi:MAG: outer membrane protein [Sphingobacteriales bacterium]|jgi:outer membrane protein
MMKNLIFAVLGLLLYVGNADAQRMCFIDSKIILENIPEYKEAQEELNKLSSDWEKEIETMYQSIDRKYRNFQAEQLLMTPAIRIQKEEEIVGLEEKAKALQDQKFGVDGELFQKREELVRPIQDRIYTEIESFAKNSDYDIILDKAKHANLLYGNEKYDKTYVLLKKMGIRVE